MLAAPMDARAQTILGRVLEEGRDAPVAGALVLLLDRNGEERAQALADAEGQFVIRPPAEGEYYLQARRLGYETTRSPLLALVTEGTAPLDLMMVPAPVGLEGLEVSVRAQAEQFLGQFDLSPAALGTRWIDRREIMAAPTRQDVGRVLQWQNIPGISLPRPENLVPGSDQIGLCVSFQRSRSGAGIGQCALVVLNGQVTDRQAALHLDPETVESIAVLLPTEATTFFGTPGGAGAILIFTRGAGGPAIR